VAPRAALFIGLSGAIFSERGDWVYFVTRKTDVTEHGFVTYPNNAPDVLHQCNPAPLFYSHRVTVWSDEVSLRRIRLSDGLIEQLIYWPSTPRTGNTTTTYAAPFCFPATAVMDWREAPRLRISISLNESFLTTGTAWAEGAHVDAPAFKSDNPGYSDGNLNLGRVHGNLEVIPLPGDDYVAAYALYDWTTPEARVLTLEPPGARLRTTRSGSLLQAATLRSRHVQVENERMRNLLFGRFQAEGVAKGLDSGTDYAFQQMQTLPQYGIGSHQHIRQLSQQQVHILKQSDALTPLLDLNDANVRDKLKPEVLETIEQFPSSDSDLRGAVLSDLSTLVKAADVMYVRRRDVTFEIRWY